MRNRFDEEPRNRAERDRPDLERGESGMSSRSVQSSPYDGPDEGPRSGNWDSADRGQGRGYRGDSYGGGQYEGQQSNEYGRGERENFGDEQQRVWQQGRGGHYGESSFGRGSERRGSYGGGSSVSSWESGGGRGSQFSQGRPSSSWGQDDGRGREGRNDSWRSGSQSGSYTSGGFDRRGRDSYNTQVGGSDRGPHVGKGPKGYTRSDDRIREEISDRMMADGDIDASDIEIDVNNGEVTLRGFVDGRDAKRSAEDLAESVQGVKEVLNQLRVRSDRGESGPMRNASMGSMTSDESRGQSSTASSGSKGANAASMGPGSSTGGKNKNESHEGNQKSPTSASH